MKKTNLKAALRPIIKECIQEILFEEGILSSLVTEVVVGVNNAHTTTITEARQAPNSPPAKKQREVFNERAYKESRQQAKSKVNENRKKMLDAIGKSSLNSLNGINIFEGVEPIAKGGNPSPGAQAENSSPLAGVSPEDPGVDISALMGAAQKWSKLV